MKKKLILWGKWPVKARCLRPPWMVDLDCICPPSTIAKNVMPVVRSLQVREVDRFTVNRFGKRR